MPKGLFISKVQYTRISNYWSLLIICIIFFLELTVPFQYLDFILEKIYLCVFSLCSLCSGVSLHKSLWNSVSGMPIIHMLVLLCLLWLFFFFLTLFSLCNCLHFSILFYSWELIKFLPFQIQKLIFTSNKSGNFRASLVAQWLRICLPMQGTRVRALVWEDPTCRGATKPVSHNYWACASGARAPQQERWWWERWWEAHTPRWRVAPTRCN